MTDDKGDKVRSLRKVEKSAPLTAEKAELLAWMHLAREAVEKDELTTIVGVMFGPDGLPVSVYVGDEVNCGEGYLALSLAADRFKQAAVDSLNEPDDDT